MLLIVASAFLALTAASPPTPATPPPPCCAPNPCLHSAPCTTNHHNNALSSFWCECPVGWSGVRCEIASLVAPVFSSNMVLQANTSRATIYGAANATIPGDTVTVTMQQQPATTTVHSTAAAGLSSSPAIDSSPSMLAGRSFTATADADGSWEVTLGAMPASMAPTTITVKSKASGVAQTLANVLIGDVFICSGQSNMALPVSGGSLPLLPNETEALARRYPHIRLLNVRYVLAFRARF